MSISIDEAKRKVVVALDLPRASKNLAVVRELRDTVYAYKVHHLYLGAGPDIISVLRRNGVHRIWVDIKLYDTPDAISQMAFALELVQEDILSVCASGGVRMMQEAVMSGPSEVYAATVPTSLNEQEVWDSFGSSRSMAVRHMVKLGVEAGVHGVVCPPDEVERVRRLTGMERMKIITPGIRTRGEVSHSHFHTVTAREAIEKGADLLVVGRPITESKDPVSALEVIAKEIAEGVRI